jgi:hypothetical protein
MGLIKNFMSFLRIKLNFLFLFFEIVSYTFLYRSYANVNKSLLFHKNTSFQSHER